MLLMMEGRSGIVYGSERLGCYTTLDVYVQYMEKRQIKTTLSPRHRGDKSGSLKLLENGQEQQKSIHPNIHTKSQPPIPISPKKHLIRPHASCGAVGEQITAERGRLFSPSAPGIRGKNNPLPHPFLTVERGVRIVCSFRLFFFYIEIALELGLEEIVHCGHLKLEAWDMSGRIVMGLL